MVKKWDKKRRKDQTISWTSWAEHLQVKFLSTALPYVWCISMGGTVFKLCKISVVIPFNKLHGVSGPLLLALVTQSETAYLRLSLSPSLHLSLSRWSPLQWPWDFAFTTRSRYDIPIRDTHGWTEAHPQTIRKSNHLPMSNSNIATLTYYAVLCPIRKPMLCLKFVILPVSKENFSLFYLCTIPT